MNCHAPAVSTDLSDLSVEIGGDLCALFCFQLGVLLGGSGVHPFFGVAAGPEGGITLHIGAATRKSTGLAWGGACTAVWGAGVYGEGGIGIGDELSPYSGGGVAFGGGVGCSYGAS
jgi:hypothetical protein